MSKIPEFKFAIREDLIGCGIDFMPKRAKPFDTGWDVKAAQKDRQDIRLHAFDKVIIPLGIRGFCPEGWWYELKPRSSTFAKKHLNCLYGTVDETFEGELMLACQYIPPRYSTAYSPIGNLENFYTFPSLKIKFGEAIGQIIPIKRQEMKVTEITNEEYDESCRNRGGTRGTGGFGSSDR